MTPLTTAKTRTIFPAALALLGGLLLAAPARADEPLRTSLSFAPARARERERESARWGHGAMSTR